MIWHRITEGSESMANKATQRAFEEGASYAVTYLSDLAERMASAIEDVDSSGAALLRYIAAQAEQYNCGDYCGD